MILSDFLSRQKINESNPHEIIPILFNIRDVLQEKYYNFSNMNVGDKSLVPTRSQAKSSRVKLPDMHGLEKSLVTHVKPERQKSVNPPTDKRPPIPKPSIGQGRAGIRRKVRIAWPLQTPAPKVTQSLPETVTQSQETVQTEQ